MKKIAVVLAGGRGSRMNSDIPKQYLMLKDRPVLYYALKAFQDSDIDSIVLAAGENDLEMCRTQIVEKYGINKVMAIVAGGAQLSDPAVQACYISMASVMVGGMVPPLGIALACIFFPKKFTKAERNSTVSNIVMSCGFITEGAIPYAAGAPIRVLPSCVAGSAVAGALSMAFGCTLMAPHGGIFVFPVVGNALMYIIALAIGSIVGAVMLGLLRKPVESK